MKTIIVLSVLLLSVIAVTTGTTITTQIQPAYSQATHCTLPFAFRSCATPGQEPTTTSCFFLFCDTDPTSHQEAGKTIGEIHKSCSSSVMFPNDCVVLPPDK